MDGAVHSWMSTTTLSPEEMREKKKNAHMILGRDQEPGRASSCGVRLGRCAPESIARRQEKAKQLQTQISWRCISGAGRRGRSQLLPPAVPLAETHPPLSAMNTTIMSSHSPLFLIAAVTLPTASSANETMAW